jgi:hypothetical protein
MPETHSGRSKLSWKDGFQIARPRKDANQSVARSATGTPKIPLYGDAVTLTQSINPPEGQMRDIVG